MAPEALRNSEKTNILIVDDRPENLIALEKVLKRPDLNIIKAASGNDALALTLEHNFALILLDVQMPDMDGFETAELLRGADETKHVPIIFVTAISKEREHVFKGYESGAVDYLFKPLDSQILINKVNVFLDLYWHKSSLELAGRELEQKVKDLEASKKIIEDQNKRLNELVIRDKLTGLFNRHHLEEIIKQEFDRTKRYRSDLSCVLLDLDFFKQINDKYGHASGDFVLQDVAACIEKRIRSTDFSFRYGGEEFLVLLPNTGLEGAIAIGESIRKFSEERVYYKDGTTKVTVTLSAGIASVRKHKPDSYTDLIAYADKALYRAKAEGRNRVKVYIHEETDHPMSEGPEESTRKDISYLKENILSIMEKTRRAAIESIQLLARDLGSSRFQEHHQRVTQYLMLMGKRLNLSSSDIESFQRVATFHDCFKILLSDAVLSKTTTLSKEERAHIEEHPAILSEMTELFEVFSKEKEVLLYHHENFDGTGYPEGLAGENIPYGARVFAIVDALVAMTSDRPYRKKLSVREAVEEIRRNSGKQFDPVLADQIAALMEETGEEQARP